MNARYFIAALMLTLCNTAWAQRDISESRSLNGIQQIQFDHHWADVIFRNWSENSIKVEGTVTINQGENDDAFDLDIAQKGSALGDTIGIRRFARYQMGA